MAADKINGMQWEAWGLQVSAHGIPLINLANAVSIMEHDPALKGMVWHDEFLQRLMTADPPREWDDTDDIELALYIQREVGLPRIGREIVSQAVLCEARRNARNCVRDWLGSLKWDKTPRINEFFSDCFGADESDYVAAASRNFWLSIVARVYRPGCKVDNMVVLEGPQGAGKSSALQIIGGPYFAEQHESATNPKGFAEILQGKLLIEISEMDSFNRAEVNRVKQTVSCPSDRFRPSYGHHAADHPRQCVFVGTTNRDDWNRDETGARRFWPIACNGLIRVDAVQQNRAQLFAEAVARHKAGEPHWLMPEDETKAAQEARFDGDPWLGTIESHVKGLDSTTVEEIGTQAIKLSLSQFNKAAEIRIGRCLRFLGWHRKRARVGGKREYLYTRQGQRGQIGPFIP